MCRKYKSMRTVFGIPIWKKDLCKAQHCKCVNTNDPDENNNTDEFLDYDDDVTDPDYKPPKKKRKKRRSQSLFCNETLQILLLNSMKVCTIMKVIAPTILQYRLK